MPAFIRSIGLLTWIGCTGVASESDPDLPSDDGSAFRAGRPAAVADAKPAATTATAWQDLDATTSNGPRDAASDPVDTATSIRPSDAASGDGPPDGTLEADAGQSSGDPPPAGCPTPGTRIESLTAGGQTRRFLLSVPAESAPAGGFDVVFVFHGGVFGDPPSMPDSGLWERRLYFDLEGHATRSTVFVYPAATHVVLYDGRQLLTWDSSPTGADFAL